MGYGKKAVDENARFSPSSSLNEALLFATMRTIGLQVDVHVKDGSVYSGIFYTASVDDDFGIVLKNAKLTIRGASEANVASGSLVETLVILSPNIVQIIAEGVSLPTNIAGNTVEENVESVMETVLSEPLACDTNKSGKSVLDRKGINHRRTSPIIGTHCANEARTFKSHKYQEDGKPMPNCIKNNMEAEHGKRNGFGAPKNEDHQSSLIHQRQGMHTLEHGEPTLDFPREDNVDVQSSSSSLDSTSEQVKPIEEDRTALELHTNGRCHDASAARPPSTDNSSSHITTTDEISELYQALVPASNGTVPMQATNPVKKPKEFKLNPGARTFSPSFTKCISPIPAGMPAVGNTAYMPSNTPMLLVPEAVQPEIGMSPFIHHHATLPSKFAPYSNLTAGNAGCGPHIPQPILRPTGNRAQPLRFTSQYHHPVQAAPLLANPNPQVMVNRLGQLVYVQPVSQDLVQVAPPALAPLPSRPLLTTQQVQYPKHQGGVVVAGQPLPQPFVASEQKPYTVLPPPQFSVLQPPFPANHPITVPNPTGFFGTKFP